MTETIFEICSLRILVSRTRGSFSASISDLRAYGGVERGCERDLAH